MKKKKILIFQFPNLNNYGTGMMGLVTVQEISKRLGAENVEFHIDFNEYADLNEIRSELTGQHNIKSYDSKSLQDISKTKNPFVRKIKYILNFISGEDIKEFDLIIVLGGDGFSEEYGATAYIEFIKIWLYSLNTKVIMLGQTMGPFNNWKNRFAIKYLLSKIDIYTRDSWCYNYLKNEFSLNKNLHLSADLAMTDLPLEGDDQIKKSILKTYNLSAKDYITFVISGIQGKGYYCDSREQYVSNWKDIIERVSEISALETKKIVLLAHTFKPYGEEDVFVKNMYEELSHEKQKRTIIVSERILQTRARHILGNGLFTITGRMHAAISSYKMGVPAIPLAYSPKYDGVIGEGLKRKDLIIYANDAQLWKTGNIVNEVTDKVNYLLNNYDQIISEISPAVNKQKELIIKDLDNICHDL
jgi:colanic acid/amylovoran biosynthesis protein